MGVLNVLSLALELESSISVATMVDKIPCNTCVIALIICVLKKVV